MEQVSKSVATALMNAAMELDSNGRKVLAQYSSKAKITQIQSSISAPWAHTVSKNINYTQDEPFVISESLIEELIKTTEEKIAADLKADGTLEKFGLHTITSATMDMLANGYRITHPQDSRAKQFSLSRANVVAQKAILDALTETTEKIHPGVEHRRLSFILMSFAAMRDMLPALYEIGLVDITYEATELGIVRDGSLQHSTHTAFGSFSLAREIAAVLDVPLSEAFGYIHHPEPLTFLDTLSESKKAEVESVFEAYIEQLSTLFQETGDELTIPKTIALHADLKSEPFFLGLVEKAAKRTTKTAPHITLVTKEILNQSFDNKATKEFFAHSSDTALLLSAMFFHKHHDSTSFMYL
jgi:cell division ATPase FtsA